MSMAADAADVGDFLDALDSDAVSGDLLQGLRELHARGELARTSVKALLDRLLTERRGGPVDHAD